MLPEQRRGALHLEAGRWLERVGEQDVAVLARHFEAGGEVARAARYFARAGERALAEGDLGYAVELYGRSLVKADTATQRARRLLGMARAHHLLGQYAEASHTLEQLQEGGLDRKEQAELLVLRARLQMISAGYDSAEALLGQALRLVAGQGGSGLEFGIRHTLFWVLWSQGRYGEAGRIAERLQRSAYESSRREDLCAAKLALAYFNVVDGDLAASVRLAAEAVEHAREVGHPYREIDSLLLLGSAQEMVGAFDDARATLASAHERATRLRLQNQLANIDMTRGRIAALDGRVQQAIAHYEASARQAETIGDQRCLAAALVGQARAQTRIAEPADLGRARRTAQRALSLVADHAPPVEAEAYLALSEIALRAEQPAEAVDSALRAVALLEQLGGQEQSDVEILLAAHAALAAVGRDEQAAAMIARASARVAERAERISEAELRARFEQDVPHNVRVRELARRHRAGAGAS